MLGYYPSTYWFICWLIVSPLLIVVSIYPSNTTFLRLADCIPIAYIGEYILLLYHLSQLS